jgi:hypothetical protein
MGLQYEYSNLIHSFWRFLSQDMEFTSLYDLNYYLLRNTLFSGFYRHDHAAKLTPRCRSFKITNLAIWITQNGVSMNFLQFLQVANIWKYLVDGIEKKQLVCSTLNFETDSDKDDFERYRQRNRVPFVAFESWEHRASTGSFILTKHRLKRCKHAWTAAHTGGCRATRPACQHIHAGMATYHEFERDNKQWG